MKKSGLGSIPKSLSWIDQTENDMQVTPAKEDVAPAVKPIKEITLQPKIQPKIEAEIKSPQKGLPSGWTRATFIIDRDLNEKIKAVAYWERLTVKEVVHEALTQYLQGKSVKAVPKKNMPSRF